MYAILLTSVHLTISLNFLLRTKSSEKVIIKKFENIEAKCLVMVMATFNVLIKVDMKIRSSYDRLRNNRQQKRVIIYHH